MFIGVDADERLQERGGDLVGEADEAELGEVEVQRFLQVGVDGDDERLHHVVQKMAEADGCEHDEERFWRSGRREYRVG